MQIIQKPETAEERLREILFRQLNVNVQTDIYSFACFICAFTDIDSFASMPWKERTRLLFQQYHVSVDDRTLRNWCKKLYEQNIIQKCGCKTYWQTKIVNKTHQRFRVEFDDQDMASYFARQKELLQEKRREAEFAGLAGKAASNQAWKETFLQLWDEFCCCYYCCHGLVFNAFDPIGENCLYEIYELTRELIERYYPLTI